MGNTRIVGDFRFTALNSGLVVEALDYHAERQLVTHDVLRELGLIPVSDRERPEERPWPLRSEH